MGMEFTTVGILTAELLVRFAVSSDKKEFLKSPLNIAEFLSFVISIVLLSVYQTTEANQQAWYMIAIVVVMKIVRLFRLARVLRNYPPIKASPLDLVTWFICIQYNISTDMESHLFMTIFPTSISVVIENVDVIRSVKLLLVIICLATRLPIGWPSSYQSQKVTLTAEFVW